jgi:hypothetical protein
MELQRDHKSVGGMIFLYLTMHISTQRVEHGLDERGGVIDRIH